MRGSGRHEQGDAAGREPVRGGSRAVSGRGPGPAGKDGCAGISPGPGAKERRGAALRLCPPRCPAPRPVPRPPRPLRKGPRCHGAGLSGAVGAAPARPDEGRPERGSALLLSASRADGSGAAGRDGGRAGAVAAGLGLGAGRCEAGTASGEAGAGRGSCCCPAGALRPGARLQCRGAAKSCAWEGEAVWGHGCCGSGRG